MLLSGPARQWFGKVLSAMERVNLTAIVVIYKLKLREGAAESIKFIDGAEIDFRESKHV